MKLLPKLDSLQ